MPPIPMSTTFARISASWPARRAASSPASVCRRLVWTQRMGSFIHQPSCAAAPFTISIRIENDFVVMPVIQQAPLAVADEFDHHTAGGGDVIAHLFARQVRVPMQNGVVYAHMV